MFSATRKRILRTIGSVGIILLTIGWLLPIIWMLFNSFRPAGETFYSGILPKNYTLDNYIKILSDPIKMRSFVNSAVVATFAASLDVIIASLAAYGFSRYRLRSSNFLQVFLLIARLFPVVVLSIGLFHIAGVLNVYDTFLPLILVNTVINLPFAILTFRSAFDSIPIELEEASWIDGATRLGSIVQIVFPVMAPTVVATAAFLFILCWNEFLFAMTFIRTPEKMLMTVTLASNIEQYHMDFAGLMAHAMIASLPILILFLIMQRRIVSGLVAGAFK